MKCLLATLAASFAALTVFPASAAPASNLTPGQQSALSAALTCGDNYGRATAKVTQASANDIAQAAVYACSDALRTYFSKFPPDTDSASVMNIMWYADWQFRGAVADAVLHTTRASH